MNGDKHDLTAENMLSSVYQKETVYLLLVGSGFESLLIPTIFWTDN
jgi:hypothetical protein